MTMPLRWLLLGALLVACGEVQGPALAARPAFVLDCAEFPEQPYCQPAPQITLGLWSCPIPYSDHIELHAYAAGATRLTATATVALDPGTVVFNYVVDGDYLHPTLTFEGFVPSSVIWRVSAWLPDDRDGWTLVNSGVLIAYP